jgi:molybdopterin molybdotransferase
MAPVPRWPGRRRGTSGGVTLRSRVNVPSPSAPDDVRMRGFARRSTVDAATAWLDARSSPLAPERVSLWSAAGRVLAEDVVSRVSVPQFARSMMDGLALSAAETRGASPYNRLPLTIVGQSLPGQPFTGTVSPGQAIRIMTGAPLPAGADTVLPAERCEIGGDGPQETAWALDEVPPGKHIGRPGEDLQAGQTILSAGRVLRPQDLGLLSSIGLPAVSVVARPRVRLIITGNELLPAGETPQDYRIADANGPMLASLVARDGGLPLLGSAGDPENPAAYIVADEPDAILQAMRAPDDLVIVSGGSSVGQEDFAPLLLAQHGELAIHGIAMRPSSPTGMGLLESRLVLLLPGNPVSCLCAYDFFAGRAIRRLAGRSSEWPYRRERLPLSRKLVSQVGRVDYARVRVAGGEVEPIAISGASILSSTTEADGFVIVPADSEGYAAGAVVDVYWYD